MGRRIELPKLPEGETQEQLQELYRYLYQMADALNNNLAEIGNGNYTDEEMKVVREIVGTDETNPGMPEAESLKTLIIKTAQLIKTEIDAYNLKLIGTYEAEGKLGRYVRKTRMDVDVTPSGITQNYTFQDIIQGLKTYEVNAKNYIKTGYLRTENNIPIYGVAIGKDVVTFSDDGTETYNDGNKVAELTADELSFWQGGYKVAAYTGTKISFYSGNTEVMYIQNGKIYCTQDMEISSGKKIKINRWEFTENGLVYTNASGKKMVFGNDTTPDANTLAGVYSGIDGSGNGYIKLYSSIANKTSEAAFNVVSKADGYVHAYLEGTRYNILGKRDEPFVDIFGNRIIGMQYGYSTGGVSYTGAHVRFNLSRSWDIGDAPLYPWIEFFHMENFPNDYVHVFSNKDIDFLKDVHVPKLYYDQLIQNSSRDVKHDIKDMESRGETLDKLRPVTFVYNDDPEEKKRAGLIYEEAAEVMPEICVGEGKEKAVNYVELIPMLLKEIQDLRARVKALEEK